MKIAFVGAEGVPYPNAFAKITEEIGWRLARRGHSVVVYCRAHFVADRSPYRGMQRVVVPSLNTKHLDTISASTLALAHALVAGRPDVVHIHGIGPAPLSLLVRMAGLKTVVQVHGLDWQRPKWGRFARFCLKAGEAAAARLPNATVVVSETLREYMAAKYRRAVRYVPQGVDLPKAVPPCRLLQLGLARRQYILFMARLVPEKGCHYLIEAYRQLDPEMPLVIAGSGAHTSEYVARLHEQGAHPRIRFVGHVTGDLKAELLSNAYLYVLPSTVEGLSLALLEAMSYGNCALVSDIPENREAAGGHAFTFRSQDADDLRRALQTLLETPRTVREKGEEARSFVGATYDWDRVAMEFERIYAGLR